MFHKTKKKMKNKEGRVKKGGEKVGQNNTESLKALQSLYPRCHLVIHNPREVFSKYQSLS